MSRLRSPSAEALRVQWEAAHPEEQYGWLGLRVRAGPKRRCGMNRATRMPPSSSAEPGRSGDVYALLDEPEGTHAPCDPDAAQRFFVKVCRLDRDRVVYDAIWSRFSGPIRLLLCLCLAILLADVRTPHRFATYVYKRYWMDRNKPGGGSGWQARFAARKERASDLAFFRSLRLTSQLRRPALRTPRRRCRWPGPRRSTPIAPVQAGCSRSTGTSWNT